jgi:hypothetical protein
MRNPLLLLLIGLFFGTGLGFVVAASTGAELAGGHDHAGHAGTAGHDCGEIPAEAAEATRS